MPPRFPDMLAGLDLPADVTGLTADSRAVRPGMLYAALPGARVDGRAYIPEAVANGAVAILAPIGTPWPEDVPRRPMVHHPNPRQLLAQLAAAQAGLPPSTLVAVTGTNGKTSTAEFLRQIFARAGRNSASLGTLGVRRTDALGRTSTPALSPNEGETNSATLTTPDPVTLAQTLAELARTGTAAAAIEASSHGLAQYRLDGLAITAAGFTNFSRDHLDYHGTLDDYRAAKLRLFGDLLPRAAPAIASARLDPETLAALRAMRPDVQVVPDVRSSPRPGGQTLTLADGQTIDLPLPGRFQADNALLAAALAEASGVVGALDHLPHLQGVRGRMELAATPGGAAVYVDFAHTPDALERLLLALRPHTEGRLVLVFGAGGDRDRGKRPLMGAVARQHADVAIVTDDNPRSEDPASIRAAIRAAHPDALEIGDRAQAIEAGLGMLRPGDVLAVAGKGHESGQIVGGVTHPFDDVATVQRLVPR